MRIATRYHSMDESDVSERIRRLKAEVTSELEARDDVTGFEFQSTDDPGVHVVVEADETTLYHVTLERHPDGTEQTHWSYLGDVHED